MPEQCGKGVGRALWMKEILPGYKLHGFTHLGASMMTHNTGTIDFYEKQGFTVYGYHSKMVNWNGKLLDAVEIEMIL